MFAVEIKGGRIGPPWYREATFDAQEDAERWLSANRDRLTRELQQAGDADPVFRIVACSLPRGPVLCLYREGP